MHAKKLSGSASSVSLEVVNRAPPMLRCISLLKTEMFSSYCFLTCSINIKSFSVCSLIFWTLAQSISVAATNADCLTSTSFRQSSRSHPSNSPLSDMCASMVSIHGRRLSGIASAGTVLDIKQLIWNYTLKTMAVPTLVLNYKLQPDGFQQYPSTTIHSIKDMPSRFLASSALFDGSFLESCTWTWTSAYGN